MKPSVRKSYVKYFGEEQAQYLENAAISHKNGIHDKTGSDSFKWALVIAIGYQCVEEEEYRKAHGITVPFKKWKSWIRNYGKIGTHDGDSDYLALLCGVYQPFIKTVKNPQKTKRAS